MVDTHSRGYEAAARWMFWSGIALFLLGLATLGVARADGAQTWECAPGCRLVESTAWETARTVGAGGAALGALLWAAAILMVLRRRRTPPATPTDSSAS